MRPKGKSMTIQVARRVFGLLCFEFGVNPNDWAHFSQCWKEQRGWRFSQGSLVKGQLVPSHGNWHVVIDPEEHRIGAKWYTVQTRMSRVIKQLIKEAAIT